MTISQIVKKNIALSEKFSNFIIKNPKAADKISSRATIIVIPKNDKILEAQNRKLLESYGGGVRKFMLPGKWPRGGLSKNA